MVLVLPLVFVPRSLAAQDTAPPVTKGAIRIEVVESSDELHESLLENQLCIWRGSFAFAHITVDEPEYQQMDGFGASLTDSSAWLLSHRLPIGNEKKRSRTLQSTKGIGLSVLRQPMGQAILPSTITVTTIFRRRDRSGSQQFTIDATALTSFRSARSAWP